MPGLTRLAIVEKWERHWFWQVFDESGHLSAQSAKHYSDEGNARAAWQEHIDAVLILHCERT